MGPHRGGTMSCNIRPGLSPPPCPDFNVDVISVGRLGHQCTALQRCQKPDVQNITIFTALKAHEAPKKPSIAVRKQKPGVKNEKWLYGPTREKGYVPPKALPKSSCQVSVVRPPPHKEVACSTVVSVLGLAMADLPPTFPNRICRKGSTSRPNSSVTQGTW